MKEKITVILVIVATILLFVCGSSYLMKDRTAPEISAPSIELTYIESEGTEELLKAVTAIDDEDGDISDQVRIYDIAILADGRRAQVTYAVYDSSYNLAKATRIVGYEPGTKEEPVTEEEITEEVTEETTEDTTEATEEEIPEGYEDLPLESDGTPVLRLTTHEVRIEAGESFYSMDYVEDAVDLEDSKEYLHRNLYL